MMSIVKSIYEATIAGNRDAVTDLIKQALDSGVEIEEIVQDGFIPAMGVVGKDFGAGKIYIPEMLLAARAMQTGMNVLKPHLGGVEIKTLAKVVLGTVQGDLHDIGKNLVGMMLEGSGIEVIDLGVDVPPEKFVEAVKTHQAQFVALSALLTTTMTSITDTMDALKSAGLRDEVAILVGGAPVNQAFADEIDADGYADNAGDAVDRVKELIKYP